MIDPDLLTPEPPFTDDDLIVAVERWAAAEAAAADADAVEADTETGDTDVDDGMGPLRWSIDGIRSAEWAMAKYAAATAAIAERHQIADEWRAIIYASVAEDLDRIAEWEAAEVKRYSRPVEFFGEHLRRWALANRTPDRATFDLPSGRIRTIAGRDTFEIADDTAAVAYAKRHGLDVKESVTLTALKKRVDVSDVAVKVDGVWQPPSSYAVSWVDGKDVGDGAWRVVLKETGEFVPDAEVWEGPFAVDQTGEPLGFLTAKPAEVTVKVDLR